MKKIEETLSVLESSSRCISKSQRRVLWLLMYFFLIFALITMGALIPNHVLVHHQNVLTVS